MTDELTVEEKILRDFRSKGKVIWHTYNKSVELEEMDLDFKILAAIHSIKQANKLNDDLTKYNEEWRTKAFKKMEDYMDIFMQIEDNLKENHGVDLPEDIDQMKKLREELKDAA